VIKSIPILGVNVHALTSDEALEYLLTRLSQDKKSTIATVNTEFVVESLSNPDFKQQLNNSSLATADGIGILWAARVNSYTPRAKMRMARYVEIVALAIFFGISTIISKSARYGVIPEQITGVDFSIALARLSQEKKLRLFLLGERQGVADEAGAKITSLVPGVEIAGTYAGDGGIAGDNEAREILISHDAEVLLVAYGAPKQELWIKRNLDCIPAKIVMGVGGTFMFLSGRTKRAPRAFRRFGVEWLYRLAIQPWRWRRQLALPRFIYLVIKDKISQSS
jgi:N-acetylglucosaminyldiphosphoundecaprenol N-acetyl-beta-D-mannosaminyltransferase